MFAPSILLTVLVLLENGKRSFVGGHHLSILLGGNFTKWQPHMAECKGTIKVHGGHLSPLTAPLTNVFVNNFSILFASHH